MIAGRRRNPASAAAAPQPSGERIEHLDGIDTSELTDAEASMWVGLVNDQLSPCGDPLSVARCVAEKHKCGACVTAARYLTRLVMEGYDRADDRAAVHAAASPRSSASSST